MPPSRARPDAGDARDEDRDDAAGRRSVCTFQVRGEVVRMARQVAFAEATVPRRRRPLVSRATGTFLLHRQAPALKRRPKRNLKRPATPGRDRRIRHVRHVRT